MDFESSKQAIVQIHFDGQQNIAGTGFLVGDGYILTCGHVVKEALFSSQEVLGRILSVTFFNTTNSESAVVIFYDLDESRYGRDAAVLHLSSPPLRKIRVPPLSTLRLLNKAHLNIFGYPGGDVGGRNVTAVTRGEISGGWIQIEDTKTPGLSVEGGFSGAPVWSDADQAIVGVVVARHHGNDQAKVGFAIPVQKLQAALQAIQRHSLLMLLRLHEALLQDQITTAYKVCRPKTWPEPFQTGLEKQLVELTRMSARKLQEFVGCLFNQPGVSAVQPALLDWLKHYKSEDIEISELLSHMRSQQERMAPRNTQIYQPCLLVRIQADKTTKAAPYQVSAWLVADSRRHHPATGEGYDPETGEGAEPLSFPGWQKYVDDPAAIDLSAGIRDEHLPVLLAVYLEQVAKRGILPQDLTVEFFLPLPLVNHAIEQCRIPIEFGLPMPLGVDVDCAHVVVRSQERLEFARGLPLWEQKWNQLQAALNQAALDTFIDGDDMPPSKLQKELRQALGLRLTKKLPKAANLGEIGILLATGTPVAVWLRCHAYGLADQLRDDILNDCVDKVPEKVCALRRDTSALDENDDPASSTELGHHLSFLWEDFHHRPPNIVYSDAKL